MDHTTPVPGGSRLGHKPGLPFTVYKPCSPGCRQTSTQTRPRSRRGPSKQWIVAQWVGDEGRHRDMHGLAVKEVYATPLAERSRPKDHSASLCGTLHSLPYIG